MSFEFPCNKANLFEFKGDYSITFVEGKFSMFLARFGNNLRNLCAKKHLVVSCFVSAKLSSISIFVFIYEPRYEKNVFCICENKDADQLHGNREADQRLCFHYTDSTIPPLPKSEISSL